MALPALKPTLQSKGAKHIFDLGPVLWKAGLGMALARTFWLFSRDLLNPPVPIWGELQVSPASITDLARRAALIYSLADPWDWRQGRHSDLLAKVYGHLDRCLQNQERARNHLYWRPTSARCAPGTAARLLTMPWAAWGGRWRLGASSVPIARIWENGTTKNESNILSRSVRLCSTRIIRKVVWKTHSWIS